jgi:hypothetical protein
VLGVWLDTKLRWSAHYREVQRKANAQTGALTRITAATWGASFSRARQVYSAVVRPALAYGAGIWHIPGKSNSAKGLAAKLQPVQNKCLRVVAGAYKATPVRALETETHTPPLDLYLDSRLAAFRNRLANSPVGQSIQEAYKVIQQRLWNKRGRQRGYRPTPSLAKDEWAKTRSLDLGKATEDKKVLEAWSRRWQANRKPDTWDRVLRPLDPTVLMLHSSLRKAESSALVQLWTGCIGLAYFLHKARVPGIDSGLCSCGSGNETPRHLLIHCQKEEIQAHREELKKAGGGRLDLRKLLDTPDGAGAASRWVLRLGRLTQFSLARTLLYE